MKVLAIALLVASAAALSGSQAGGRRLFGGREPAHKSAAAIYKALPAEDRQLLHEYVAAFPKKQYATPMAAVHAVKNLKESAKRFAQLNARAAAINSTARYGFTKFSDLSREEFRTKVLMSVPIPADKYKDVPVDMVMQPRRDVDVPNKIDWRPLGAVTPVKDQEQCGSCWAFSATEEIESQWIMAGRAKNTTIALAPQQIVDCDTTDMGCSGGNTETAYEYVISAGGMDPQSVYPYTAEDGTCKFNAGDVKAKISNYKYATSLYSETTLQANLVSAGPISVCVDAANWQDYQSGVMTWTECALVNVLDHCVQLVGYDATDSSNPYWIVRNSWNTDWGVAGYIYLEMWEDTCGIAHDATIAVV